MSDKQIWELKAAMLKWPINDDMFNVLMKNISLDPEKSKDYVETSLMTIYKELRDVIEYRLETGDTSTDSNQWKWNGRPRTALERNSIQEGKVC